MSSFILKSSRKQGCAAAATAAVAIFTSHSLQVQSSAEDKDDTAAAAGANPNDVEYKCYTLPRLFSWRRNDVNKNNSTTLLRPFLMKMDDNNLCLCEASASATDREQRRILQRNQTIGRLNRVSYKSKSLESLYKVDRKAPPLGEGSFGAVYLATSRESGENVALKRIPKSMTDDEAFQREMNALLHIQSSGGHPHICALHDSFNEGSYYYLTLDFVGGGEMFDHLVKSGAYSEANASRLVREVASALAFLHGIGIVHNDLKPENLMLSSPLVSNGVIKLVDFGCATVSGDDLDDEEDLSYQGNANKNGQDSGGIGYTVAYSPPEKLLKRNNPINRPSDMWALGVILYIMLTGLHPFDISGDASDEVVGKRIKAGDFPLRNSDITAHLSKSAIDLIERLMERNPAKRLTAHEMLSHPWVTGETATTDIIKGSDKRLSKLRMYKSGIGAKFFRDAVAWSDEEDDKTRRRTCLIERSFQSLDERNRGFLTEQDLGQNLDSSSTSNSDTNDEVNTYEGGGESLSMSDFHSLLSENMQHKFYPRGTVIYNEGEIGNHMYFINSGTVEVVTKDGSRAIRTQGDFFGEGALLHPKKLRSATIRCKTPVHAFCISREYFDKYLSSSESGLLISLREKDKIRKRNRSKAILRLQNTLMEKTFEEGEHLFDSENDGNTLYIVESGKVDILVRDKLVFSAKKGNIVGEYSVLTGRNRNCTAICAEKGGNCTVQAMSGRDFRKLTDVSPEVYTSLRDLCLRREFKKAVVHRLGTEFPYHDPRKAFDAVKAKPGTDEPLGVDEIKSLMKEMNPEYDDAEIMELIDVIDLTKSGNVSFDEFKKVFIANIRLSASI